jgi:two-component system, OmpR family, sensor histidine kinase QseC
VTRSLNFRLLVAVWLGSTLVWFGLAAAQYWQLEAEVDQLFDAHIADAAEGLHSVLESEFHEHAAGFDPGPELDRLVLLELQRHAVSPRYGQDHFYQVRYGPSGQYLASALAPSQRFVDAATGGFMTREVDGRAWRLFIKQGGTPGSPIEVVVGEPLAVRQAVVAAAAERLAFSLVLGLGTLLLVTAWGVQHALRPMHDLARTLRGRTADDRRPIEVGGLPREVEPLLKALNGLLERLADMVDLERRFTADAAHELRTPLAGLRLSAQVAARLPEGALRTQALAALVPGVDRMTRLVEQLLTLARVESDADASSFGPVAVANLFDDILAEFEPLRRESGIAVACLSDPALVVWGNADLLAVALGNLLTNARLHARAAGKIELRARPGQAGCVELEVADDGAGIPEAEHAAVMRRFYRRQGTRAAGSGLGLAIVARIVELHAGQLSLGRSAAGGLLVRLALPMPSCAGL